MIEYDMTYDEYAAAEGIRSSVVAEVWKSPRHAQMMLEKEWKKTKALVLGSFVDMKVFNPEAYDLLEFKECQESMVDGCIGIKQSDTVDHIYWSLRDEPMCETLIFSERGETQSCYFWEEKTTSGHNIKCKLQLDRYIPGLNTLVDLKTTNNAETSVYRKDIFKYLYDVRLEHYAVGLEKNGKPVDTICIVAVETKPPYLVNIFEFGRATRMRARATRDYCLDTLAKCMETGNYPGYPEGIKVVEAPAYVSRIDCL